MLRRSMCCLHESNRWRLRADRFSAARIIALSVVPVVIVDARRPHTISHDAHACAMML
jgi:hypothetical protein